PIMLSKKCKYAIHALVHMAKNPDEKYLIKEISEACRIPKKFLEAILLDLKRAGILGSKSGKGGGYTMRASPSDVKLAEVVRHYDGSSGVVPCAPFIFYLSCDECEDEETWTVSHTLLEARNATVEMLKSQTMASLVKDEQRLINLKRR